MPKGPYWVDNLCRPLLKGKPATATADRLVMGIVNLVKEESLLNISLKRMITDRANSSVIMQMRRFVMMNGSGCDLMKT